MILIISKLPLDMVNVKHEQGSTVLVEVNESLFILSVLALYFEEKKKNDSFEVLRKSTCCDRKTFLCLCSCSFLGSMQPVDSTVLYNHL